jgi:hypothetical protein
MSITTKAGAAALVATLALGAPTIADARPGGPDSARGGDRNVPVRVASKLRAAERAIDRAQERAEDGETAGAVAALTSVRKNLASALTAAKRRITADGGRRGPASAGALSRTDGIVISGAVALLDGADASLTGAGAQTLDAALDNRDAVIAAIAALDVDGKASYRRVLSRIVAQTEGETEAIEEALSDDVLTDEGRAALQAALTQLAATKAAAQAQGGAVDVGFAENPGVSDDGGPGRRGRGGDCPPRRGEGAGAPGMQDETDGPPEA